MNAVQRHAAAQATLRDNGVIRDDPDIDPSDLRFSVGNLVMYRASDGWFEGEIVKVSQRLTVGSESRYIAYIVWPNREDVDGTDWVMEDTMEQIKPRMEDKTPDPAKVKPTLAVPDDPMHFLYTNIEKYDSKTSEGTDLADLIGEMDFVEKAGTNPDGSISFQTKDGRQMTSAAIDIPQDLVCGVEPMTAMMYAATHISQRQPMRYDNKKAPPDMIQMFKAAVPTESSLAELERKAKSCPRKMLQLADVLMTGMNGWPRDPNRACTLYRASGWGCKEEEEPKMMGMPNGIPEGLLAAALLGVSYIKCAIMGSDNGPDGLNMPFEKWMDGALNSEEGIDHLLNIFDNTAKAVLYHGHVTSFTLMLAKSARNMNFLNDRRVLRSGERENFKIRYDTCMRVLEYREKEIAFQKMQDSGKLPRGDPSTNVIELFKPKALEIFTSMPKLDDTLHIVFKQVPRSPFPMVVIAFYMSKKKVQKVVRLPPALQMTPFSTESFMYVWLQIAYDIHIGRLGTGERVRPARVSVPNTHGNKAFASYLENILTESDTTVACVSPSDSIKKGKRRTTLAQLENDVMAVFLDVPGILMDGDLGNDMVARAQEAYFDNITQQIYTTIDDDDDDDFDITPFAYVEKATHMKAEGNQYFAANDFNAAVRCYSFALGHMRRVVEYTDDMYKLLGTLLSNRAACFLSQAQGTQHSLEFRKIFASNAIKDCTSALGSSWASSSLPESILEKLRFRCDKATAEYDTLNENFEPVANIFFPSDAVDNSEEDVVAADAPVDVADGDGGGDENASLSSASELSESKKDEVVTDALIEYGQVISENRLAKNAEDGCPICLRRFNTELQGEYAVVLPCGEHALCAQCIYSLKVESDKEKNTLPQCPLCRYSFHPEFVEAIPSQVVEKDQELAHLVVKLPSMTADEQIAIAERLMWTHRFEVSAVVDAIETLLDGDVSAQFFRSDGDLTHEQKNTIYNQARAPVVKLETQLKDLTQEYRDTYDSKGLEKICRNLSRVRRELAAARIKARDDVYSQMNSVGSMGAEEERRDSSLIQVDYHGLYVNEMRRKFKEHVLPILPVVKKVLVITGRGSHSAGKESKLKKALFKLVGQYEEDIYFQRVDNNEGALYVLWREK